MKEEYSAIDMATAAADGFRDGQRASAELAATLSRSMSKAITGLPKRLRIKASMIALGERIAWGSDTALMEEAADVIEALIASVENHQLHMLGMARDRDQLRAMLSEQTQASAAQSAQAGESKAFEAWAEERRYSTKTDNIGYCHPSTTEVSRAFKAGAAWQRTQAAWVPEAKVTGAWESARIGDFNAGWNACRDSVFTLIKKAAYMELDTTKRSIATQDELRALLAAAAPVQPAAQAQPEVQSRERWTVMCGHWKDTTLAIHGERTGHIASGISESSAHAIVKAHNEGLPPENTLASAGQEGE